MNFIRFILILIVALLVPYAAASQTDEPKICISQEAANRCADNARLIPALEEKIRVLEAALAAKEQNERDLRLANERNVADLTDRLQKTEIELSRVNGQLIECRDDRTYLRELLPTVLKMTRKRSIGLIAF